MAPTGRFHHSPSGELIRFRSLTWAGHGFLEAVRDPETWAETKRSAASVAAGGFTMDLLRDLATSFIKKKIEDVTGAEIRKVPIASVFLVLFK